MHWRHTELEDDPTKHDLATSGCTLSIIGHRGHGTSDRLNCECHYVACQEDAAVCCPCERMNANMYCVYLHRRGASRLNSGPTIVITCARMMKLAAINGVGAIIVEVILVTHVCGNERASLGVL
jgi:hypothetical protein